MVTQGHHRAEKRVGEHRQTGTSGGQSPRRAHEGATHGYGPHLPPVLSLPSVFDIVAEPQGRRPPGGGGRRADPPTGTGRAISGTFLTQNGQKKDFSGSKNGPKMAPKWPKWPKIVQKWPKK